MFSSIFWSWRQRIFEFSAFCFLCLHVKHKNFFFNNQLTSPSSYTHNCQSANCRTRYRPWDVDFDYRTGFCQEKHKTIIKPYTIPSYFYEVLKNTRGEVYIASSLNCLTKAAAQDSLRQNRKHESVECKKGRIGEQCQKQKYQLSEKNIIDSVSRSLIWHLCPVLQQY